MVGILVVAHGNLAESLIETAELIVGHIDGVKACSFCQGSDVEKLRKMLKNSIKEVNNGDGVIILTDMFGGTPSTFNIYRVCIVSAIVLAAGIITVWNTYLQQRYIRPTGTP